VIASTLPDADVVTHGPERMEAVLETAGLVRATRRETLVWTFDLYRRGRDV
jgi:hypothetical protein